MLKNIIFTSLLATALADSPIDRYYQFVEGFLYGAEIASKSVTPQVIRTCISDNLNIINEAIYAVIDFQDDNFQSTLDGFEHAGKMIDFMSQFENRCNDVIKGWQKIDYMSNAWREPASLTYNSKKELVLNGVNLDGHLQDLIHY